MDLLPWPEENRFIPAEDRKSRTWAPHSLKQDAATFSEKKITLCTTGIQWGKGEVGSHRTKKFAHEFGDEGMNHLICAPTYKILTQATRPSFERIMKGLMDWKREDAYYQLHSGGKVWCRTGTDPDSIVGITDIYHIWGDECGLFSYYFWLNIQARSRFKRAPITLTTSPYAFNWIAKDLIKGVQEGKRDDIHWCQAASKENPYFPEEEDKLAKATMSLHDYNKIYGGIFAKKSGLVYDIWDDAIYNCKPFNLPEGAQVYGGIDWGFSKPFCLILVAVLKNGSFYVISEIYQTRLDINDIIDLCKQRQQIWKVRRFYAGPDEPGNIAKFKKEGLRCSPADNSVKLGISDVYGLLREVKLRFFEDCCPNLLDEKESYHWPEDKELKPDQNEKDPNPVKQDDHALDALRYVIRSTLNRGSEEKKGISVPEHKSRSRHDMESTEEHIARLRKKSTIRHEKFS